MADRTIWKLARRPTAWAGLLALAAALHAGQAWLDGGALAAAPLLLFARMPKEAALDHPRRRAVFEYVQRNPGTPFREVARSTGMAAGTARHHLNVLLRSGHIVERTHRCTVRFFENDGRFDANWGDLVMLREPALADLHAWLSANPGAVQKEVLEAMLAAHGWNRSTTQHRLKRLADNGVVLVRMQGRYKAYCVRAPAAPPGPVAGAVAVGLTSMANA